MKVFTNSDSFGSISIKLLVNEGKIIKVIRNCTIVNGHASEQKCNKCVYFKVCGSLKEMIEHL